MALNDRSFRRMQGPRWGLFLGGLLLSTVSSTAPGAEQTTTEVHGESSVFQASPRRRKRTTMQGCRGGPEEGTGDQRETAGLRYHLGFVKENLGLLMKALLEYQRAEALVERA